MSQPTPGDVHVNVPLTNLSIGWMQAQESFIADKVFPIVPSPNQSNRYYVYNRDDFFRVEARDRAPGTESAGSGYRVDNTPSFFCKPIAVHKDVDDMTLANADSVLSPERDATEWVSQQLMLKKDRDWASRYFTTGVWSTDTTPGTLWSSALSTPILDIRTQIFAMQEATGFKPNTLVLGARVWQKLADHVEFLERIKFTQKAMVDTDLVASLLGLDRVVIAQATNNTAVEGATASYSYILGKHALLCYSASSPGLYQPSAGYTFSWTGYLAAGPAGQRIKRFRNEPTASTRVEGEMCYDFKCVAPELGCLFANVVA